MEQENLQSDSVVIRKARKEEVGAIQEILLDCNLPPDDVGEHWKHFLVAFSGERMVGTVGLEVRDTSGLLRSLAVVDAFRGKGIGKLLYERIVASAADLGITELGLLTTTAEGFFARVGFLRLAKAQIPDFVSSSKEYKIYCPSSAVCMTKSIRGES